MLTHKTFDHLRKIHWRRLEILLVRLKNGAPKAREMFVLHYYLFMRGVAKKLVRISEMRVSLPAMKSSLTQRESVFSQIL